jgi:hypothetical protein
MTTLQPVDAFDGDFDMLPLMAHFRYGVVPTHPTSDDFQLAAIMATHDGDLYAEAHWFIEAIRERRLNPGRLLDDAKRGINARVAARLYRRAMEVC